MNQLLKGKAMTIFGDGAQQRAFTHVNDVAPIIAESVDFPAARNQIFNVGADVPFTVNELAKVVADALNVDRCVQHLEARNEVKYAFSDHGKAERVFGKGKKTSLEEGIMGMARWVKCHGARESNVFKDIEIMKHLPPSWARAARAKS
jgi:UDP-glucose 4-epimerase